MRVRLPAPVDERERPTLTRRVVASFSAFLSAFLVAFLVFATATVALAIPAQAQQTTGPSLDIAIDGDFADWELGAVQYAPNHVPGTDSSRWSFTEPNPGTCAIDRWGSDSAADTLSQVGTFTPALGGRPTTRLQNYVQYSAASRHCFQAASQASPGDDLYFLHSLERLALPAGSGSSERLVMSFSCSLLDGSDSGDNIEAMACARVVQTQNCPVSSGCTVGNDLELQVYACDDSSSIKCGSPSLRATFGDERVGIHNYQTAANLGSPFTVFDWTMEGDSSVFFAGRALSRQRDENIEFSVPRSVLGFGPGEVVCSTMRSGALSWTTLEPLLLVEGDIIDDKQGEARRVCDRIPSATVVRTLTDGQPSPAVTGNRNAQIAWTFDVPAGARTLKVVMDGQGDADLHLNYGAPATLESWVCRPYVDASSSEQCTITDPAAGTWHVMAHGYTDFSGITVTATTLSVETVLADGVVSAPETGLAGDRVLWVVDVPAGTPSLKVTMQGFGDADLHLQRGSVPTLDTWTCRPYLDANSNEECNISNPLPGRWYIMAHGYSSFSNLTAVASLGGQTAPLINGVASAPVSGAIGEDTVWTVDVPVGTQRLEVRMTGQGDADLYVRQGQVATQEDWDCRPYVDNSTNEVCVITNPTPGRWFVSASGYRAYANTKVTASWQLGLNDGT